ncbi:ABC transporter permease subunit [Pseudorhodobacter sp. W20_MBD10_FR17]|uniref:ABC transporter permease subunit n=1 Tax=Pseudorhodobacter sp. W20_MBD10_FR17 TaxID=3240266 RepID=UPI003F951F2F
MSRSRIGRAVLDMLTTICLATPPFLTSPETGIIFPIMPVLGDVSLTKDFWFGLQYLILPAFAIALPQAAVVARLLQTSMNTTRREDFGDLARAKGVPQGQITRRQVLRNSLGPAIVAIGLCIGGGALRGRS